MMVLGLTLTLLRGVLDLNLFKMSPLDMLGPNYIMTSA
jgi:hypothetical protein